MAKKQVLPAQLKQPKLKDIRNNNLGGAVPAIGAGLAGGAAVASAGASLSAMAIPALVPLLANPVTAPVAILVGATLAASPWIYNKAKQWSVNNKIDHHERKIEKLSKDPNLANDPKLQQKLQHSQQRLGQLTGSPNSPQPQGGQHQQQVGNLLNAGGANGAQGAGQNFGGQQGGVPESSFWGGTRAYNEQVPLFTGNQQAYQNEVLQELRNNPANFNAIRENEINRFHEETAPRIAEQYFGKNTQSFGSAYPEALGRGGANLASKLAAMQQQFQAEREGRLQNIGMSPSYTTVQHPKETGFGEDVLRNVARQGVNAIGEYGADWLKNKFGGGNINETQQAQVGQDQANAAQPITGRAPNITPVNGTVYQQPESLGQFANQNQDLYGNMNNPLKKLLQDASNQKSNYALGGGKR